MDASGAGFICHVAHFDSFAPILWARGPTEGQLSPRGIIGKEQSGGQSRGARRNPHPGTPDKLAKALDVSPGELLEDL